MGIASSGPVADARFTIQIGKRMKRGFVDFALAQCLQAVKFRSRYATEHDEQSRTNAMA